MRRQIFLATWLLLNSAVSPCLSHEVPEERDVNSKATCEGKSAQEVGATNEKKQEGMSPSGDAKENGKIESILDEALRKQLSGSYFEALKLYDKALDLDKKNAKVWARLGSCYQALEEWRKSESAYRQAYELDPTSQKDLLYFMAVVDEKLDQKSKALEKYTKYVEKNGSGTFTSMAKLRISELTQHSKHQ